MAMRSPSEGAVNWRSVLSTSSRLGTGYRLLSQDERGSAISRAAHEGEYMDIVDDDEELLEVGHVFEERLRAMFDIDDSELES